jgi:hypothetical protein
MIHVLYSLKALLVHSGRNSRYTPRERLIDLSEMEIVTRTWEIFYIRRRTVDGYFDATNMWKAARGWQFYEYQRSARGAAYIEDLQKSSDMRLEIHKVVPKLESS